MAGNWKHETEEVVMGEHGEADVEWDCVNGSEGEGARTRAAVQAAMVGAKAD